MDLNHSTVSCSLMYKEVVFNYLQNDSNVYSCLLDAPKAFNRIHFGKLFALLIERNVPLCFIRLILDAYTRQQFRVSWNNCFSKYFSVSNGVFFFSCRYITLLSSTASHISAQCHCISAGHQLYTLVAGVGSLASVPLSVVPLYNRMWCHHHSTPICSYCICIFQLSFSVC